MQTVEQVNVSNNGVHSKYISTGYDSTSKSYVNRYCLEKKYNWYSIADRLMIDKWQ